MERLPGFRDFYPEPLPHADVWSADARQYIFERWRATARRYGFREYDGPPLEPLELFTTKSGEEIVGQLYNFMDKGEPRGVAAAGNDADAGADGRGARAQLQKADQVVRHPAAFPLRTPAERAGCASISSSTPTSSAKPTRRRTRN